MVVVVTKTVDVTVLDTNHKHPGRRTEKGGYIHIGGNGCGSDGFLRDPEVGATEDGRFGAEASEFGEDFVVVGDGAVHYISQRRKEEKDLGEVHNVVMIVSSVGEKTE